ncbi:hypothetical protein SNE40_014986 [Patella caerulea]|uniref:Protein SHQ1 homolog n=1 Tax=Patella caerulea TaxID=87958 RepID=A0AAN8PUF8_PATCE
MLTPAFEIHQDNDFLFFYIKAPYTKISDTEIFIEDNEFKFFSKPYFLRLNLPGQLIEDGRETAIYDSNKGHITIKVPKKTQGEVFEGLDMLTKLLAPKGDRAATEPLIEVLGSDADCPPGCILDDNEIDWYIEQKPYEEPNIINTSYKYGFAGQKSGIFSRLANELKHLVDVNDPDNLSPVDRLKQRQDVEDNKFDDDHYLADLYQDDVMKTILAYQPDWNRSESSNDNVKVDHADIICFNDDQKERMRNLPKKEYVIDKEVLPSVYLSLVDLIYSYCYNHRITEGDDNVESGWNICKLSSTLSWFVVDTNPRDVIITNIRRSLCFPLHRHWQLAIKVLEDTQKLFELGKRQILKCLLEIHQLFHDCDSRYILNDIYITDYCVWLQSASDEKLKSLAKALKDLNIKKIDVKLNLEELEAAAKVAMEEDVSNHLEKLTVADSDDESTESSDEDTTGSSYTDSSEESTQTDDASEGENESTKSKTISVSSK